MSKYSEKESSTLELKRQLPQKEQVTKTIIAFCNQHGGRLIIGVANDGTVVGVEETTAARAIESLSRDIYEACIPPILPLIYTQIVEGKTLLIIEVSSGINKPYYLKKEGLEKGVYIRLGSSTLRANDELIEELRWHSRGKSYDVLPLHQSRENDLDRDLLHHFFAIERDKGQKNREISQDLLFSYYLLAKEHHHTYATAAGILLFGKKPQHFLSEAFIICSHFKGIEGRETLATIDCTGTLFEQFHTAMNFIIGRLSRAFAITGRKRKEILEIPEEALREALLNAIAHRNYRLKSPIKIAIYDNRLEIFSPGTFPGPLNTEKLKLGISYMRNIAICKVLREAGYIEKLGSGFLTIFTAYERRQLQTPTLLEGENYVKCLLPRGRRMDNIDEELQPILDLFLTRSSITTSYVMEQLQLSRINTVRRFAKLLSQGAIQREGKGRGVIYKKTHSEKS